MAKAKKTKTVLYITDIGQLLPLDAKRKGRSTPLEWGKLRSPADCSETGIIYNLRVQDLRGRKDGFAYLGIYGQLLTHFGFATIAPLRGWIVNHRLEAASTAQIGQAIGCGDLRLLARALKALVDVGLLSRVDRPDFETAVATDRTLRVGKTPAGDGQADDTDDSQADDSPDGDEAMAEGEADNQREDSSGQRPDAGRPPDGPPPGDVRRETSRPPDRQTPTPAAATPPPPSADGCGRHEDKKPETATAAPSPADPQAADAPPETPSPPGARAVDETPSNADATDGQTADAETRDEASGDVEIADSDATHMEPADADERQPSAEPPEPTEADPGQHARQGPDMSWHAESFAQQVMAILYPDRQTLVIEGRKAQGGPQAPDEFEARELGCLRNAFDSALCGLDQVTASRLLQRSIQEATRTLKVRCRTTRGRYWRWWFGQYVASLRRERAKASGPSPGGG